VLTLFGWLLRRRLVRGALLLAAVALSVALGEWLLVARLLPNGGSTARAAALASLYGLTAGLAALMWLRWRGRRRARVRRFETLLALSPRGFEEEVGRLLADLGYHDVRRVGGPGDLGADLVCRDRHRKHVVVQCKRYAPGRRVGSADVQAFIGMITVHHKADRGIFVTTAGFTAPALELARQHEIELFDGARLAALVVRKS
jgi:restriction system protein